MPSFRFRYSAFCISFLRTPSRLTVATPAPQPSPLRFPAFLPLAFALGLVTRLVRFAFISSASDSHILPL
jgi:hypothetical protein